MRPPSWEKIRTLLTGHRPGGAGGITRRDQRHAFQVAVLYRQTGGLFWYKGTTENASNTGILFRGEKYIPVGTAIEMAFTSPARAGTRKAEGVFCWGTVVRTAPPSVLNAQPALATKILRYRSKPQFLSNSDTPFETAA
ncbi:MAG: PilZ domain-containing protein [Acidobacteriia bacterium]|nr:PilZ domain-containing protein [Terriglobia bacterium]